MTAAAAAVVIFVGGALLGTSIAGSNSFDVQQASALAAINAAPDAQRASADVDGGGPRPSSGRAASASQRWSRRTCRRSRMTRPTSSGTSATARPPQPEP
ncbi:hypothetical protein [Leifsonia poae]|uniref:hypothetical protein n=1 Tax=Leifsonia poae TaxID=110933 RepID=UPI003D66D338